MAAGRDHHQRGNNTSYERIMPAFRFKAVTEMGDHKIGTLSSDSLRAAKNELRSLKMTILEIEEITSQVDQVVNSKKTFFSEKLSFNELVIFTRQLSSLIGASLPLEKSLLALSDQAERKYTKELITSLRSEINAGTSFSNALGKNPSDFSEIFRGLVNSGEQIGQLSKVLAKLADYLERRQALLNKVRLAFTYPAIVTIVAFLVVIFLLTYVVPQVVSVFAQTQQTLPFLTQLMLMISSFVKSWGIHCSSIIVGSIVVFRFSLNSRGVRLGWHNLLLRLPLYGKFEKSLNSVRFTSTLAISSAAGVPILTALEISRETLSNLVMKIQVDEMIEDVREGMSLSKSLASRQNFPPLLVHMIRAGEITGNLPEMLDRASDNQESDLERRTLLLANILEPALILFMGAFVLLIVLAVLMPIIEINQLIQ